MVEVENKVQRYEYYKDSGEEWLGEIPKHWTVGRLGSILNPVSSKNHPNETLLSITREKGVIVRDMENLDDNHNFIPDDLTGYKLLKKGQFGMNKMKAWQGSYGVSSYTGIVSPAYYTFEFTKDIEPRFFHIAIRSKLYVSFFGKASDGVRIGQWDLSKDRMKRIPLAIPPLPEQTKIAQFLDDKTTKIDDAIAIKQQQINLLKERKQILIHKAVTRGLDDSVTLKDSGVEWIGEIPEGWEVSKFKYFIKLRHGHQFLDNDFKEEGVEVVKITQLHKDGYLDLSKATKVSKNLINKYTDILIKENDILMCLTGGTIGKIIKVGKVNRPLLQNYRVGHFSSLNIQNIINNYIFHLMTSDMLQQQIFLDLGETGQPNIGMDDMNNMVICIPPLSEQKEISGYIETASQKIETAIGLKQQEIEKLKEYKSSLINGVVTGKVRVC
jgi:type I restriction enzyme S subunit